MKRLRYALLLFGCLPVLAWATPEHQAPIIPKRIAHAANALAKTGIAPAVVVAMVNNGRSAIVGYGKLADGKAPNAQTIFQIGSVTKTFTALLLARAVLNGSTSLDTPVAKLLPQFTLPSRDGKAITLGLLAEHFSGLPKLPNNMKVTLVNPYAHYDAAKLRFFLAHYKLTRAPGSGYAYSNVGFGLLGYALTQRAGMGYGALLNKKVLQPLGMTSTGVTHTGTQLAPALRKRLAPGYLSKGHPAGLWYFQDAMAGAGALYSDAHDLLIYVKANMGIDKTPVYPAMKLAQKPRREFGARESRIGRRGRIGLGWAIRPTPDGNVIVHAGDVEGYTAFIGFSPDHRRGVVVLANSLVASADVEELAMAALSPSMPVPPIYAGKGMSLSKAVLDQYTGKYALKKPGIVVTILRKGDQLYGRSSRGTINGPEYALKASARDTFFADLGGGISLTFQRNAKGKVDTLVWHQAGQTLTAPRQP